ncbi:putative acetyltransferase involved in intracellular survival and like acetyltransferase [Gottschalkia purinilytica]|uniref:Putative acetyltransferase involved in intracellular survival and like acetyltransferase n=1 Tax=Gottschalkia purinilytica TaxID=1503 RepID=A0A0L0WBH8_GOTPU|nr:GNAT family N-acetyltransferase [Gottschalkia purinilytica]KNF08792.1 putative acetyltransferase involved in intracellular survival and like acetyltransferase [Gottschalkia purinilytica]
MIKLLQYPQTDYFDHLKKQILLLQNIAWLSTSEPKAENVSWPKDPKIHLTSFVLIDNSSAISNVTVLGKNITHKGRSYKTFGLSEVVTHPSYRKQVLGLQLIKEATKFIENNNPDISIFTCEPSIVYFYTKEGWIHMENTCTVGGTLDNAFRSDSLGLATMMRFFSDKSKKHRQDFEHSDVYLELGKKVVVI